MDSSALAKRYLKEIGSTWILNWIEPTAGNVIVISELAFVEIQSLLARHVREGTLTPTDANTLLSDFLIHYRDDYLVGLIDTGVVQLAGQLVHQHKLRTLDAIQLASASHTANILSEPMTFVSADNNLLTAASAQGFRVDNPHTHP